MGLHSLFLKNKSIVMKKIMTRYNDFKYIVRVIIVVKIIKTYRIENGFILCQKKVVYKTYRQHEGLQL